MKQCSIVFSVLFTIAFSLSSLAQIDSIYLDLKDVHFVYLKGGKIIEGEQVIFHTPLLKRSYISIDDLEIKSKEVQFYQDQFGFHANVSNLLGPFNLKTSFAPRIKAGKINLYELIRINNGGVTTAPNGGFYFMPKTERYDYFYNKGFGILKKANYQNLKLDLQDNYLAMQELQQYKKRLILTGGLYVGAGVLIISGISAGAQWAKIQSSEAPMTAIGLILGGAALGWTAYFVNKSKFKHLNNAVIIYNQ